MRWGPRFEVPKVIVLFCELKQERSGDVRGNESTTLSLLTGLPPSFSANVNAGSLGALGALGAVRPVILETLSQLSRQVVSTLGCATRYVHPP